jgi:O-antigen ligase
MNLTFYKSLQILFLLIPIFLITGPALPDIIITLVLLYFIIYLFNSKNNKDIIKDSFFLITIIFWLSIIFISFFAIDKIASFQDSLIFVRILIIPTLAYFLFFNSEKAIKNIVTIIFFCVIFVSLDTLYQFFNYESENGFGNDLLGFKSNWYGRLTGPFGDELVPGAYVSKFGLLGYLFFIIVYKKKSNYYLEVIYLSLICIVCFGSGERMALATYLMALFFILIFLKEKRKVLILTLSISIFLIFIIMKLHPFYNDYKIISSTHYHQGLKIEKYFDCNDNNNEKCSKIINLQPTFTNVIKNFKTSAYGEIYSVGLNMFKNNPLTGVGISNYQTACLNNNKYNKIMINYNCASHPHNIYIQWISEGGIITLITFMIFIISLIYIILKSNNSKIIKIIALATILILFWPIMSTGSLIKNWNGILTFYIIALCICINRVKLN